MAHLTISTIKYKTGTCSICIECRRQTPTRNTTTLRLAAHALAASNVNHPSVVLNPSSKADPAPAFASANQDMSRSVSYTANPLNVDTNAAFAVDASPSEKMLAHKATFNDPFLLAPFCVIVTF